MSAFPLLYGSQRLQRLQRICAEDDVSLLFIVGIDSKHNVEAIKFLHYLCFGATGKDVLRNDIDEALIGGNKATEPGEEDESVDNSAVTGINIVLTHKLVETGFGKDTFKDWLKTYMKA